MTFFIVSLFFLFATDDRTEEFRRALNLAAERKFDKSEQVLSKLIKENPDDSDAYYYRGRIRFQTAQIKGSVADFDRLIELRRDLASRQWERGISLYYNDQFKEGAEQFELYQSFHDNDVENSTWRFLCLAKQRNIEIARKTLLPIKNDTRIPMMEIYKMYQGTLTPKDVLKAVDEKAKGDREKNRAQFYANLYIGLLKEAEGKEKESLRFIENAASHRISHYMWDVANVHLKLRKPKKR